MKTNIYKANLALLAAMLLWSTSFVSLKATFAAYEPMFVIFARLFLASIFFLFIIRKLKTKITYKKGDYRFLILMALFEPCLYFIFEAKALIYTTASQAGMITSMLPLLVAIAAFFILKERISYKTVAGFITAASGAAALSIYSDVSENAPYPALGNFLEFGAMICAAGYTITLKKMSYRYDPFFLTAIQSFVGCIFFLPMIYIDGTGFPRTFVPAAAAAIVYMALFITVGAYGLFNYGVSKIEAGKASAFINLLPMFSVFWGWLILNENMNKIQYIASAFVLAGVYLSQADKSEKEAAREEITIPDLPL
jgi:drug/metabolite transporter (DMT)-like permease